MHVTDAGKHVYIIAAGKGTILKTDLKSGMFYYIYIYYLEVKMDGRFYILNLMNLIKIKVLFYQVNLLKILMNFQ